MVRCGYSHPPVRVEDKVYDLDHLKAFCLRLEGHARDGADLIVRIRFCNHVYSIGNHGTAGTLLRDENGQERFFCPQRYQLSLQLPRLCRNMIRQKFPTWISQDKRRVRNLAVAGRNPRRGQQAYHVYYTLWPSPRPGLDVEMEIVSAYNRACFLPRAKRQTVLQVIKRCYYDDKRQP